MATQRSATLSIGKLAERTGLAVSAIRFYDSIGLVKSDRNAGGQRQFRRSDIRRLSFVLIAQQLGFTLEQIREQLDALPDQRTPTQRDWQRLSRQFKQNIDQRIDALERLRGRLSGCIGCGCLSLKRCSLYNPDDRAASLGVGPRYLLGDEPEDIQG
jgi:MerR family redox-sensitive transcriptional activator SoxR